MGSKVTPVLYIDLSFFNEKDTFNIWPGQEIKSLGPLGFPPIYCSIDVPGFSFLDRTVAREIYADTDLAIVLLQNSINIL